MSTYPTVTRDWEIAGARKPTLPIKSASDKNYVSDIDSGRPKPRPRRDGARSDVEDLVKSHAGSHLTFIPDVGARGYGEREVHIRRWLNTLARSPIDLKVAGSSPHEH
jgi:hypothetical protein